MWIIVLHFVLHWTITLEFICAALGQHAHPTCRTHTHTPTMRNGAGISPEHNRHDTARYGTKASLQSMRTHSHRGRRPCEWRRRQRDTHSVAGIVANECEYIFQWQILRGFSSVLFIEMSTSFWLCRSTNRPFLSNRNRFPVNFT